MIVKKGSFVIEELENVQINIGKIGAEQVQAVANKYLNDDKLTVATLDPQPIDETAPKHKEVPHGRH